METIARDPSLSDAEKIRLISEGILGTRDVIDGMRHQNSQFRPTERPTPPMSAGEISKAFS